jgi:regulator of sirC expression with transglutaminase-like and TPR domain
MWAAHPGRRLLLHTVRRPDNQIDLIRAALAIAWEDLGAVDVEQNIRRLDRLAQRAQQRLVVGGPLQEQARQIVAYLYYEEGFSGNTGNYDDPDNSYLPQVIERRVGLPITLALVLLHVGWGLGLPFEPAALPAHFMVRCPSPDGVLFLDLFHGRTLDSEQCRAFLQHQIGHAVTDPLRLPPPSRRQVLARLLRNLKGSYFRREEFEHALAATERILMMEPESGTDLRDRGLLRARLGDLHRALLDLERYAAIEPLAADQQMIRKHARTVADSIALRN